MSPPARLPLEVLLVDGSGSPPAQGHPAQATLLGAVAAARAVAHVGHRRACGGRRADLGNRYFRSMWEANWARYLNFLVLHRQIRCWEYEPQTFWFECIRRGTRSYTPDFRVTENDGQIVYHEIKGYLDRESRTKLKRMALYHPSVRIRLIDEACYRRNARSLSRIIPGWETQARVAKRAEAGIAGH
jgi:hypothetical protein